MKLTEEDEAIFLRDIDGERGYFKLQLLYFAIDDVCTHDSFEFIVCCQRLMNGLKAGYAFNNDFKFINTLNLSGAVH